jgi:hypothetical protein
LKCLSLKQPYAELVISGRKTIELRTWNTKFRGDFLVHASKSVDKKACERNRIDPSSVTAGAIVGKATLYDVKVYTNRQSFVKDKNKHLAGTKYLGHYYGFLIGDARRYTRPRFVRGKLGFFNVNS